ncbi:patatin-like phospholipase family protein [Effusibacillus consociatus]|uniref:Patatin-like phospholipase family protein n=1 Tax=Effusibacillus consociatus TaxID=1117041 RepID=A0ABV9Q194_9BACL
MTKLGLALGGGGTAGCAHLGVLLALEEAGIQIDCLAGTSSGAIVAALYGYGYSAKELIDMVPSLSKRFLDYDYQSFLLRLVNRTIKIRGFIKGQKLHDLIADKTNDAHMTDLKIPVALLSADIKEARKVIFTSHPLENESKEADVITDIPVADAVQASFSIPVVFSPVLYGGRMLVDGGVLDNCPVDAVRLLGADRVIAVDLVFADPVTSSFDSVTSILTRVVSINLAMQAKQMTRKADILLRPEVGSVGILDFSKLDKCIQCGYEYTRSRMNEIKEALAGFYTKGGSHAFLRHLNV